jgi:hypothetical protein
MDSVANSLKDRLNALKSTSVALSAEDAEEAMLRDQIAAEEARIAEEKAKKRALENARILDAVRKRKGQGALLSLMDLGEAGTYVVTNPPKLASEAFQEKIRDNGNATALDVINLVMSAMEYPNPEEKGVDVRDKFDEFAFAAQSLSAEVLRLGGLKIDQSKSKNR